MQQVSGVNVYYTLERETPGPKVKGVYVPVINKEEISWMSNKLFAPVHYSENIINTVKYIKYFSLRIHYIRNIGVLSICLDLYSPQKATFYTNLPICKIFTLNIMFP